MTNGKKKPMGNGKRPAAPHGAAKKKKPTRTPESRLARLTEGRSKKGKVKLLVVSTAKNELQPKKKGGWVVPAAACL